jgi:MFS transporter, BCD family, chlorophyll transporter
VVGFLLVGVGMHTTQTAGLALATDLAPDDARPRVVALLYVMLLIGTMVSAIIIGRLLIDFNPTKLVQIVQGAAVLTMVLNLIALWKQEARNRQVTIPRIVQPSFSQAWRLFIARPRTMRLLVAVGLGAAAFSIHDVLLEPYGGQILGLSVGSTTLLTAAWAFGMLVGFAAAARKLADGDEPHRLAGFGGVVGMGAFLAVIFAGPLQSPGLLGVGAVLIGLGNGLFSVGTLIAAMAVSDAEELGGRTGLALGAWGAVQATCAGAGIALGAIIRDLVSSLAESNQFGPTLSGPLTGYAFVYSVEILLLVGMVVAIGPLVGGAARDRSSPTNFRFGLAEFPI